VTGAKDKAPLVHRIRTSARQYLSNAIWRLAVNPTKLEPEEHKNQERAACALRVFFRA
jgi:hypothetical protein